MAGTPRSRARQFWGWLLIALGVLWMLMTGGCTVLGYALAQEGQRTPSIPWDMLLMMVPIFLIGLFAVLGGCDLLRKAHAERQPDISSFD